MNIGDIFFAFRGASEQLEADAKAGGAKAGDAGAKSFGDSFKKGVKVVGGAVAAGLTVALVGRFAALESATASFRQETGATAEEAARASKAINDMAGGNVQSVEEIGQALTKVHTDLGLTGTEAEKATEQFLKFATASGQDASGAVLAFDDILDAWGLTAASSGDIMDKLVLSHQKYGGSIEENQAALSDLAPAMRAANLTYDDGIGLLNLFAASGVDASAASTAMTKALTKVKSPEELKKLIDDITATEDPLKRAAKAADLFGVRAGAKLANALANGGMDDFKVSAEEAAGATVKAADASLTMVDRIKLAFSGFISGTVDLLGPYGPLLTAVGSLGTLFAPLLGKAFSGSVGLAAKAIAAAGTAAGITFAGAEAGGGMLGALASRLTAALPALLARLGPLAFIGVALTPRDTEGEKAGLAAMREELALAQALRDLSNARAGGWTPEPMAVKGSILDEGLWAELIAKSKEASSAAKAAVVDWQALGAELYGAGAEVGQATVSLQPYFDALDALMTNATRIAVRKAADEMALLAPSFKSEIQGSRSTIEGAMDDLMWAIEHPMKRAKRTAQVEGDLTGKALAKALRSTNPDVRAEGERVRAVLIAEWEKLTNRTWDYGKSINQNLARGQKASQHVPVDAAETTATQVAAPFKGLGPDMWTWGNRAGMSWAKGLTAATQAAIEAGAGVVRAVGGVFRASSPPTHPLNPMRDIVKWGQATIEAYGTGMLKGAAGLPFGDMFGGLGLTAPVSLVPSMGALSAYGGGMASSSSSSVTHGPTYNVNVQGLIRAETPEDIGRALRRVGRLGNGGAPA